MTAITEMSGREVGRRIFAGIRSYVARSMAPIAAQVELLQKAVDNTPAMACEMMRAEIDAARMESPPTPALTVEDFRPMLEAMMEGMVARHALDFQRELRADFQREVDRMPRPKDGDRGEDGESGTIIERIELMDDDRTVVFHVRQGDALGEFRLRLPTIVDRGVYRAGQKYERGDAVTFSGSLFIAQRDTSASPEKSTDWRLAVKRGRDGKDAEPQE